MDVTRSRSVSFHGCAAPSHQLYSCSPRICVVHNGSVALLTYCSPAYGLRTLVNVSFRMDKNFAALRALAVEGIQKGHMALHARNIASAAGAPSTLVPEVSAPLKCAPVCVLCVSYASLDAPANEVCGIR